MQFGGSLDAEERAINYKWLQDHQHHPIPNRTSESFSNLITVPKNVLLMVHIICIEWILYHFHFGTSGLDPTCLFLKPNHQACFDK